jgi:hypothetical protein
MEIGAIYCDMDQVLVNFLGGARKAIGREFNDPVEFGGEEKWPVIGLMPSFWLDLEWMPGAQLLWTEIKDRNTYILSATPKVEIVPLCSLQKKEWCVREMGIASDRVLTVTRKEKKNFAVTNGKPNLLIDDHLGNVTDWQDAGGYGIHHHTIPETIEELRQFVQ